MKSKLILQSIKNQIEEIETKGVENINQYLVEQIYQQVKLLKQKVSQPQPEAREEDSYIRLLCSCCPD